jgi:hypothetical protein
LAAYARGVLGLLLVLAALATPALADNDNENGNGKHKGHDKQHPPIGAPELDPGSMLGGLTVLVGGAFLLADRRCRSKSQVGVN